MNKVFLVSEKIGYEEELQYQKKSHDLEDFWYVEITPEELELLKMAISGHYINDKNLLKKLEGLK